MVLLSGTFSQMAWTRNSALSTSLPGNSHNWSETKKNFFCHFFPFESSKTILGIGAKAMSVNFQCPHHVYCKELAAIKLGCLSLVGSKHPLHNTTTYENCPCVRVKLSWCHLQAVENVVHRSIERSCNSWEKEQVMRATFLTKPRCQQPLRGGALRITKSRIPYESLNFLRSALVRIDN